MVLSTIKLIYAVIICIDAFLILSRKPIELLCLFIHKGIIVEFIIVVIKLFYGLDKF